MKPFLSKQDSSIIKGIAILLMLWMHLFAQTEEYAIANTISNALGQIMVSMFLFVSGYGLAIQYEKKVLGHTRGNQSIKHNVVFTLNRLVKFYLGYWPVFILFVPLGVFVFDRPLETAYALLTPPDEIDNLLGTNVILLTATDFLGINGHRSYNITWWFNQLIIVYYVLFPVFYNILRKYSITTTIVAFAITLLGPTVFCRFFFSFAVGSFWALTCLGLANDINSEKIGYYQCLLKKKQRRIKEYLNGRMGGAFLIGFLVMCLVFRQVHILPLIYGIRLDGLTTFATVLCIQYYCKGDSIPSKSLSYIGKHSMNMYMTHSFFFHYFTAFSLFVYSFNYSILIFVVLVLLSLVVSITIEFIKEKCGTIHLQHSIVNKINNLIIVK